MQDWDATLWFGRDWQSTVVKVSEFMIRVARFMTKIAC